MKNYFGLTLCLLGLLATPSLIYAQQSSSPAGDAAGVVSDVGERSAKTNDSELALGNEGDFRLGIFLGILLNGSYDATLYAGDNEIDGTIEVEPGFGLRGYGGYHFSKTFDAGLVLAYQSYSAYGKSDLGTSDSEAATETDIGIGMHYLKKMRNKNFAIGGGLDIMRGSVVVKLGDNSETTTELIFHLYADLGFPLKTAVLSVMPGLEIVPTAGNDDVEYSGMRFVLHFGASFWP